MEEQGGRKVGRGPGGKGGQTTADLGPLLESGQEVPAATHVEIQTSKGHSSPKEKTPRQQGLGRPGPRTNLGDVTGAYSLALKV